MEQEWARMSEQQPPGLKSTAKAVVLLFSFNSLTFVLLRRERMGFRDFDHFCESYMKSLWLGCTQKVALGLLLVGLLFYIHCCIIHCLESKGLWSGRPCGGASGWSWQQWCFLQHRQGWLQWWRWTCVLWQQIKECRIINFTSLTSTIQSCHHLPRTGMPLAFHQPKYLAGLKVLGLFWSCRIIDVLFLP